jgi:transposase
MSKPYSPDLRVVAFVKAGASRHEAAERFEVSVSSASGGCNAVFGSGARPSSQSGEAHRRWRRMPPGCANWSPSIRI